MRVGSCLLLPTCLTRRGFGEEGHLQDFFMPYVLEPCCATSLEPAVFSMAVLPSSGLCMKRRVVRRTSLCHKPAFWDLVHCCAISSSSRQLNLCTKRRATPKSPLCPTSNQHPGISVLAVPSFPPVLGSCMRRRATRRISLCPTSGASLWLGPPFNGTSRPYGCLHYRPCPRRPRQAVR